MKRKSRQKTIETKIFIPYVFLLLILVSTIYVLFFFSYYRAYKAQVTSHLQDVETLTWDNIEGTLQEAEHLSVRILADSIVQDGLTGLLSENNRISSPYLRTLSKNMNEALRDHALTSDSVAGIRIVADSGNIFTYNAYSLNNSEQTLIDEVDKEQIYLNNGRAHWEVSGDLKQVTLSRAVLSRATMQPIGYMTIFYNGNYICKKIRQLNTPYEGNVYLLDNVGRIIAAENEGSIGKELKLENNVNQKNQLSRMMSDPLSGDRSYYYVNEIADTDWQLVITVKAANIWKNLIWVMCFAGMLLIVLSAVSMAIIKGILRKALEPAKQLQSCMKEFGEGNLNARMTIAELDEIGQISDRYNSMADNIQNLLEKVYNLEIARKAAEIDFLKMQINPHFLYNTLDTISWMGYRDKNEDVTNLTVSLAKLLRYSSSSEDFVAIEKEIDCIQEFLEIQKYRFKDRFEMSIEVDEEVNTLYMPKFLLQPLVENSFSHGLEGIIGKGHFLLTINRLKESVRFVVKDDGMGISESRYAELMEQFKNANQPNSIGLINVYRRLSLLYGEKAAFSIKSKENEGTEVSFEIPIIRSLSSGIETNME